MNIDRAIHEAEEIFRAAAEARAEAERLEKILKHKHAVLFTEFRNAGKGVAESEKLAMATETYASAMNKWAAANGAYRLAEAEAETKRLAFEAWRTENATERAKMQLR